MAEAQGSAKPPAKSSAGGDIYGMPPAVALAGGTIIVVVAYLMWRKHQLAKTAASSSPTTTGTTPDYAAGLATDQASALYSQLTGLQGQVGNLSAVSGSVLSADQATTAADQQTTTADQATTAAVGRIAVPTPAAPGVTPPPPPAPSDPNLHYTSDGSISLDTLARWNNSTPARIIAATQASEPSDVANYLKRGQNATLPAGTKWNIPRN